MHVKKRTKIAKGDLIMTKIKIIFTLFVMSLCVVSFAILPNCNWLNSSGTPAPTPVVNGKTCWQYISYFGRLVNVGQGVDHSTPEKFNKAVADHNQLYTKQYGQPNEIFSNGKDGYFTEYVITYKVIQNSVEVIGVPDNIHIECDKKEE